MVGWIVALLAIAIVLMIYYFRRNRGRNRRRPPVRGRGKETSRSWKGLEQLERRSRNRYVDDDIDPNERV